MDRPTGCVPISNAATRYAAPYTPRAGHDHPRLRQLRRPDNRHHPQPQPPKLLATLPRRSMARPQRPKPPHVQLKANGVTLRRQGLTDKEAQQASP